MSRRRVQIAKHDGERCDAMASNGQRCCYVRGHAEPDYHCDPYGITAWPVEPRPLNVYLASSWRNPEQPRLVRLLRESGHKVYDFRNPRPGNTGFQWSAIDPKWVSWTADEYRAALKHPVAESGFELDMSALRACDVCVLLLPSGRSAHLEAGWAAGAGKRLIVVTDSQQEPELMAKMADAIVVSDSELLEALRVGAPDAAPSAAAEVPQ